MKNLFCLNFVLTKWLQQKSQCMWAREILIEWKTHLHKREESIMMYMIFLPFFFLSFRICLLLTEFVIGLVRVKFPLVFIFCQNFKRFWISSPSEAWHSGEWWGGSAGQRAEHPGTGVSPGEDWTSCRWVLQMDCFLFLPVMLGEVAIFCWSEGTEELHFLSKRFSGL